MIVLLGTIGRFVARLSPTSGSDEVATVPILRPYLSTGEYSYVLGYLSASQLATRGGGWDLSAAPMTNLSPCLGLLLHVSTNAQPPSVAQRQHDLKFRRMYIR
jgi:hypothetical protein